MQDTQEERDGRVYRAHDYFASNDVNAERRTDKRGRPLKKNPSGIWVIDTPEAESNRVYALQKYYELRKKEEANAEAYEESRKEAIHKADEKARELDAWSTRDIADMWKATTDQVRGWIKRGVLEADRELPHGRYTSTSFQVMKFWYWTRQNEQDLLSYAGAMYGKKQRQKEKQKG